MIRIVIVVLMMGCCIAAAPATRAVAKPAPLDPVALHTQAFELMLQGDIRKATIALEKVYKATPAPQRNRALVLNRAIIDMTQKTYVMRALKDLTEYLTKNRDPDEHATNILGGALNIAVATNPKLKQGDLWQTAFREWDRRNYVMHHARPGYRRWGTRWVSAEEHERILAQREELRQAVVDQAQVADRAYMRAWSLSQQYTNALNAAEEKKYLVQYLQAFNPQGLAFQDSNHPLNPASPYYDPNFQPPAWQLAGDMFAAEREARRLGPEMQTALREFQLEMRKLTELQNKVIRPDWPTAFEPVDPNGPEADKPPALPPGDPDAKVKLAPQGLEPLPPPRGQRDPRDPPGQ